MSKKRILLVITLFISFLTASINSYAKNENSNQLAIGSWQPLFNGRDLTGWSHVGNGNFTVEDHLLKTQSGMGVLWYTPRKLGNCIIKVVYKTTYPTSNSGVFVRIAHPPKDEWDAVHHGYEIQILDDPKADDFHRTGAIYIFSKVSAHAEKPAGQWNIMEITLKGPLVLITLNGMLVNKFDSNDKNIPERKVWSEPKRGFRPDYGYIGVQNEDHMDKKKNSHVYFKEISVKDLN